MSDEHCCGPKYHGDFFNEVLAVFKKHPEAARNYAIACIDHETEMMGIDFATTVGINKIDGNKITTEFTNKERWKQINEATPTSKCCKWDKDGNCIEWWV